MHSTKRGHFAVGAADDQYDGDEPVSPDERTRQFLVTSGIQALEELLAQRQRRRRGSYQRGPIVKLELIRLKRVPGIDPAFTIQDLSPGINVVIGPNGSGKTSFRKAVAATLWPSAHPSKQLEVQSEWKDGDRRLDALRDGGAVTWTVDDANADAPAVPPAHLEQCYTLGVSELLLSNNVADQAIAKEIRVADVGWLRPARGGRQVLRAQVELRS